MSDHGPTGALTAAICAVMAEVGNVKKTGKNSFHNYAFASETDVLRAVQPAMAAAGLSMLPTAMLERREPGPETGRGRAQWITTIRVTYTLSHTSGERIDIQAIGVGIDGEDKGAAKAMTGALKYALRQAFLIPTGDDPDEGRRPPPRQEPQPHHATWEEARKAFCAELGRLGTTYAAVAAGCERKGMPRPSEMDDRERGELLVRIRAKQGGA